MLKGIGNKNTLNNKAKMVNPVRKVLSIDEFADDYRHFMKANPWNLHELQNLDNQNTETAQEAVQNQQLIMMDDKHFHDTYMKIHVVKSQIEKDKVKAAQKAYLKKHSKYYSSQVKDSLVKNNSGAQRIQKLVNEDKCNYSKLSQYQINDVEFTQDFMVKANSVSKSSLLMIPEEGCGGHSRSLRVSSSGQKARASSQQQKSYQKNTQSQNQKGKDQSKIPLIQPSKPKGSKPPIQLKPIVKLPKSSSASNMKSTIGFTGPFTTNNQFGVTIQEGDESLKKLN